jgi:hypothetical protein
LSKHGLSSVFYQCAGCQDAGMFDFDWFSAPAFDEQE